MDKHVTIEPHYTKYMAFNPGDKVTWENNIGLSRKKQRIGIFLTYLPPGTAATYMLPKEVSKTRLKGKDIAERMNRAIVAVPRGGKSDLVDYYIPNVNWLLHAD